MTYRMAVFGMEVEVKPPDYYPVVDKFIVSRIEEGFSALGATVKAVSVKVHPEKGRIGLDVGITVDVTQVFLPDELPVFTSSLLEKAVEDANDNFGSWNNVRFYVRSLRVKEERKDVDNEMQRTRITVTAPIEKEKTEKLAKGLVLWLVDRGFSVESIDIALNSVTPPIFSIHLRLKDELDPVEKEKLREAIVDKVTGYSETLFGVKPTLKVLSVEP